MHVRRPFLLAMSDPTERAARARHSWFGHACGAFEEGSDACGAGIFD